VKRALKVLSEREVTPQLGLLKSTLLQLDSTFSERDYGASSFRDFMEKVAQAGAVTLRHAGRSMLVEAVEDGASGALEPPAERPHEEPAVEHAGHDGHHAHAVQPPAEEDEEAIPQSPMTMQDGIRALQQAFNRPDHPPRWPMYVRQAKQFLRNTIEGFDERKYGFASVVDLLRAAGREGVLRLERDRQGAIRVFPGVNIQARPITSSVEEAASETVIEVPETVDGEAAQVVEAVAAEAVADAPIVDAEPVDPIDLQINGNVAQPGEQPRRAGTRKRKTVDAEPRGKAARRAAPAKPPKARTPRPRARKTSRGKTEAAET
jgi:hypothetical protein